MAASTAAILLLALVVSSFGLLGAQAAADCTAALTGLTGCAAYLTNTSTTPDEKTCCTPLNTVLTTPSSFQCLCAQASSTGSASSGAFQNALLLPKKCKLSINVSQANCTSSSASNSTSPSTASSPNAGVVSASPWSHLPALALLGAFVSLLT